ncbi:MAG: hypothetical protein AB7K71_06160 [Polyangiaceae bacterium]
MAAKKTTKTDGTTLKSKRESDTAENPRDRFFRETGQTLAERPAEDEVLLSIPIWGYPNHGKTTMILTAIHFCEPSTHGLSLALVSDTDELEQFERCHANYRGLNLAACAESTRDSLSELLDRFCEENEFPHATEKPSQYLVEIQTLPSRLGWLLLPDIKGGSYETSDPTARNALRGAHAMILVVDPSYYVRTDPDGMQYKKEILRRIQACAKEAVPTCVALTMADRYGDQEDPADLAEKRISELINAQRGPKENFKVLRVSAIGHPPLDASQDEAARLPPPSARRPDEMLEAWVWTISAALKKPSETLRSIRPERDLQTSSGHSEVKTQSIVELRPLAELSAPGRVIFTWDTARESHFLFLSAKGLTEYVLPPDSDTPSVSASSEFNIPDWETCHGFRLDGCNFLGAEPLKVLWHGQAGSAPVPTHLAIELLAWCPVGADKLVGISADGSLHALQLREGQWEGVNHVKSATTLPDRAVLHFLPGSSSVLVVDQNSASTFHVDSPFRLGGRFKAVLNVKTAGTPTLLNSSGFFLRRGDAGTIHGGRETEFNLGNAHKEWTGALAMANGASRVAWVDDAGLLRIASLAGKKPIVSSEEYSQTLNERPTGVVLTQSGNTLVATLPTGTSLWLRVHGMTNA